MKRKENLILTPSEKSHFTSSLAFVKKGIVELEKTIVELEKTI